MLKTARAFYGCLALAFASGCASVPAMPVADVKAAGSGHAEGGAPHCQKPSWTYGPVPPARGWNGLCQSGRTQSPILLDQGSAAPSAGNVVLRFLPFHVVITNLGYTASVAIPEGSGHFTIGEKTWDAYEVHFHTNSEHALAAVDIGGPKPVHARLEMHVKTHLHTDKKVSAVFAVLFDATPESPDNDALKPIFDNLGGTVLCVSTEPGIDVNLSSLLLPFSNQPYFSYSGSLTTPDCTEGIQWYVLATPESVSSLQVIALSTLIRGTMGPPGLNNRPLQSINPEDGAEKAHEERTVQINRYPPGP